MLFPCQDLSRIIPQIINGGVNQANVAANRSVTAGLYVQVCMGRFKTRLPVNSPPDATLKCTYALFQNETLTFDEEESEIEAQGAMEVSRSNAEMRRNRCSEACILIRSASVITRSMAGFTIAVFFPPPISVFKTHLEISVCVDFN